MALLELQQRGELTHLPGHEFHEVIKSDDALQGEARPTRYSRINLATVVIGSPG